ncbi:UDP-N-acetylmuramoyl-L-alanine--D-glutamate ligase [Limibacillus sp. MBR-115]|jgi:UDP-N-acetylmuramoylalanine--D-glutamate ligase|uniref:UDP-N-acetylmuramoyl-L-alanine--D-glutamate ligase n=1 Tax=Limibacillus sp. MBR-115 TaxID=3156465 RepID=UPI00339A165D
MIDLFYMSGFPVAVMGLGKSGIATARSLIASGAEVRAWDDNEDTRAAARAADIPLVDLYKMNWDEVPTLVLSPGIPDRYPEPHPVAAAARAANVEIVCDIELLVRAQREARYLGVTGTNGKSTTTALIGHIMSLSGAAVETGGNLGTPALQLDALYQDGTYVLELSSYQLERIFSITFDTAVLLNISPDHLDRHGGLEGYIAAKKQIFRRQTKPRTAVIGIDDDYCRAIHKALVKADDQRVVPISASGEAVPGGVYVLDRVLYDDMDGEGFPVLNLDEVPNLPGRHNWQNAAAAYAACKAHGVPAPVAIACIRSFPGLAHRQQLVSEIDGIRYINDSKATNADAAAKALACYDDIYWILGGRAKEGGLAGLEAYYPKIAHAFLIGESAETFAKELEGKVATHSCGDLASAVVKAQALAAAERRSAPVVLLSPACASFDQFANFEARGKAFIDAVRELEKAASTVGAGQAGGGQ